MWTGPWRVDYHNNINVQMNYWPACSANLDECMFSLIDFIRTLVKPERNGPRLLRSEGWTALISGNIFGFTAPLESQDMSWNFNPMAGAVARNACLGILRLYARQEVPEGNWLRTD